MFDLDRFIIDGHQKIIGHYERLRETASSKEEQQSLQKRIDHEQDLLAQYLAQRSLRDQLAA